MNQITDTSIRYTVFDPQSGEVHGRGLSVHDAGMKLLTHDGRTYGIEADSIDRTGRRWIMFRSQDSGRNKKSLIGLSALAETKGEALALLAVKAVTHNIADGRNPLRALTDQLYDKYARKAKAKVSAS